MIRIPLAQRLGKIADAALLTAQFSRLWCDDYFATLDGMLGDTDYYDDAPLAGDRQLAVWVSRCGTILPGSSSSTRTHVLYRALVAPFTKLKEKGENMNHE